MLSYNLSDFHHVEDWNIAFYGTGGLRDWLHWRRAGKGNELLNYVVFESSVPTLICIDRLAPLSLSLIPLTHKYPQAQKPHICTRIRHSANLTTDCAMLTAKNFGGLKTTFTFQKQQPLISMHALIDSCLIFPTWYELWMEKLWYFELIWTTVLLTVVWPWYC